MRKLVSIENFESSELKLNSNELKSLKGGIDIALEEDSVTNTYESTTTSWNCADQDCISNFDFNGHTSSTRTRMWTEQP